jgi:hypothetical protein
MPSTALAVLSVKDLAICIGLGFVGVLLFPFIHCALNRICLKRVRKYCASHSIEISGWRLAPEFGKDGIKTENTCVEILSEGPNEKKIYRFIVWVFGIRDVSEFTERQSNTK